MKGTASTAPSTACSSLFQGTTRAQRGHIVVKPEAGSQCLEHLSADEPAFPIIDPTYGSVLTRSPNVDVPVAQGYQKTVLGALLLDENQEPILGDLPDFTDIWISGVAGMDNHLFKVRAPNVEDPIFLVAQDGKFRFASKEEQGLGASIFPETSAEGRILLINTTQDCDNTSFEVKELDLPLEDQECAHLYLTKDGDGNTIINYTVPEAVAGFLRRDPDAPCVPRSGDDLSSAEMTQFLGFLTQAFCESEVPGDITITRAFVCGSRVNGSETTEGAQPATLQELYDNLRTLDPPGNETLPVDYNGDLLVNNQRYDAIWDGANNRLVYIPASREIEQPFQEFDTYNAVNQANDGEQSYSQTLATYGIVDPFMTHARVVFTMDVRGRVRDSNDECYLYVKVGNIVRGWCGVVSHGQATYDSGDDMCNDTAMISIDIPIVSGTISYKIGHIWNSTQTDENEFYARSNLVAIKQIPTVL